MFTTDNPLGAKKMSRNGKPPKDVYSPYEVVRVLPGKPIKFISQVREWEDVVTHWYGRHSEQCSGKDDCHLCLARNARVWKAYLLGVAPSGGNTAIFQLTPLSAAMLEEQTKTDRGLLGAIIVLTRKGERENSPLEASLRGWAPEVYEKPFKELERVVKVLYKQYGELKTSEA
jgi:hypothetical protein